MIAERMYLSFDLLDWPPSDFSVHDILECFPEWDEQYRILAEAEKLIRDAEQAKEDTRQKLYNIIVIARRSIEARLSIIEKKCAIRSTFLGLDKKEKRRRLDILLDLGIVKNIMLRNLTDLRNSIEHEGSINNSKIDLDYCKGAHEYAWYFLRSTDYLCGRTEAKMSFRVDGGFIDLSTSAKGNWEFSIDAQVRRSILLTENSGHCLLVENLKVTEVIEDDIICFYGDIMRDEYLVNVVKFFLSRGFSS